MSEEHEIQGDSASLTVTVKEELRIYPAASATEHVTGLTPLLKVEPGGGMQTGTPMPGQLSDTPGREYETVALHWPRAVFAEIFWSVAMIGASVSFTVTVKEQGLVLPEASLTEQLTSVVPLAKAEPEGGVHTGTPTPGQLSETLGEKLTTAEHGPGSVLREKPGQFICGGSRSLTVTEKVVDA